MQRGFIFWLWWWWRHRTNVIFWSEVMENQNKASFSSSKVTKVISESNHIWSNGGLWFEVKKCFMMMTWLRRFGKIDSFGYQRKEMSWISRSWLWRGGSLGGHKIERWWVQSHVQEFLVEPELKHGHGVRSKSAWNTGTGSFSADTKAS